MSTHSQSPLLPRLQPAFGLRDGVVTVMSTPRVTAASARRHDVVVPMPQKLGVGAVAGLTGTCVCFPIDISKSHVQNAKTTLSLNQARRSILAADGVRGLYRGLLPNSVLVMPEKALKLAGNDYFRNKFSGGDERQIKPYQAVAAGACASFLQVAVTTPMEITKLRMQLMKKEVAAGKPAQTLPQIVRSLGIRGLYTGNCATLIRDIPYNGLFFPLYAVFHHQLIGDEDTGFHNLHLELVGGAGAAMISAWFATPADVVKTRLQSRDSPYKGWMDCFVRTLRGEGVQALFKGASGRMAVQAPLYGIALTLYGVQKQYLRNKMNS